VAVASAAPDASVHLAPDRQPRQHSTTQFFLQAGCPSCRPTNSVKALIVGQRLHKKFLALLQFNIKNATTARHDVLVHENYAISYKNAKTEQKQHH